MAEKEKEEAAADARHDGDIRRMDERMDAFEKKVDSKFDAIMDAFMNDRKDRQDSARKDAARKDKFGKRKDGESYKDWKSRHDADEKAMCDAMRKDSSKSEEDCSMDAKDARKDAEEEEKRGDEDFEKWAKEEEKEPEHKGDSEEEKAKKEADAKKDAEEKEKEEKVAEDSRKDAAALRAENSEMKLRLERLESTFKREQSQDEVDALAAAQSRADSVAAMFGDRAPPPKTGEAVLDYRKRLITRFKKHSPSLKDSDFMAQDAGQLAYMEDVVYADAINSARTTDDATPGVLVPHTRRDRAGREITEYHGDIAAFLAPFVPQQAQMVKLNMQQRGR